MDAVAARLEDSDRDVRKAAVETLGKLELAALAQHEHALAKAAKLDEGMKLEIQRSGAAELLAKLRAGL